VSKRSAPRRRLSRADDGETITGRGPALLETTRRELDHRKGTQTSRDASRRNQVPRRQHVSVTCDKQDIYGKSHEEGMDEVRRRKNQRMFCRQAVAPQQPAVTRAGITGKLENRRNKLTGGVVSERQPTGRRPQQRPKKMVLQRARLTAGCRTG
jgi:hypothetical protein